MPPAGWSHHPLLGHEDVYADSADGIVVDCADTAGIIRYPVRVALTDDVRLRWSWRVDRLPSSSTPYRRVASAGRDERAPPCDGDRTATRARSAGRFAASDGWVAAVTGALMLLALLVSSGHLAMATTFGPRDSDPVHRNDELGCPQRTSRGGHRMRRLRVDDVVVASFALPCDANVWILNPRTGLLAVARVADRGPGRARRWTARFDLDLSPRLAALLGHNGRERVLWWSPSAVVDGAVAQRNGGRP